MDLEEALRQVREGDQEAYAVVIELTERSLRAFLALRLPDRELVDESAHLGYITAYEKLNEYKPHTHFETWLRQMALFHLRNARRKHHPVEGGALERLARLAAPSVPDRLELTDDVERLRGCLEKLDANARQLIELRYRECLEPAGIAERTGRNAATVRSILTRLRQMLRQCMEASHAV